MDFLIYISCLQQPNDNVPIDRRSLHGSLFPVQKGQVHQHVRYDGEIDSLLQSIIFISPVDYDKDKVQYYRSAICRRKIEAENQTEGKR